MGRLWFPAIVMVVMFFSVSAWSRAEGGTPTITGIRVIKADDGLGVELSADRDLIYTCYKMPQLQKVVIDFPGTASGRPDTLYRVNSEMIATIKVVQKSVNDVMITRVAINLAEDADFRVEAGSLNKKTVTVYLSKPALSATPASTITAATETPLKQTAAEPVPMLKNLPEPVIPSLPPVRPGETVSRESLTVSSIDFSLDAIVVKAESAITEFSFFTLGGPDRLVIDIPSAKSTLGDISVPDNRFGVVRARAGIFNGKLRLVFEAGKKRLKKLTVVKTERGLKVVPAAVK